MYKAHTVPKQTYSIPVVLECNGVAEIRKKLHQLLMEVVIFKKLRITDLEQWFPNECASNPPNPCQHRPMGSTLRVSGAGLGWGLKIHLSRDQIHRKVATDSSPVVLNPGYTSKSPGKLF